MTASRREFLERLTAGAVVSAGVTSAFPDLGQGTPVVQGQEVWDVVWPSKIVGSHRAVFDATEIEDGAPLLRAHVWRSQYLQFLKVAATDLTPVLVIRHNAIPLAMSQEFWDKYHIGEVKKVKHPFTEAPLTKNPILMTAESGDLPKPMADFNLAGLLKVGGVVLACNLALNDCASTIAKADKVDPGEARKRALAMLNPGVILQPSGVFATILAQENGCQYLRAS